MHIVLMFLYSNYVSDISENMTYDDDTLVSKCMLRKSNEVTISTEALVAIIISVSICFIVIVTVLIIFYYYRRQKSSMIT